jgi:hypothetical protein
MNGLQYYAHLLFKPKPVFPVPFTTAVYKPGIGITITRANIDLLKQELKDDDKVPPTPHEVVMFFACQVEQAGSTFRDSKTYARRLARASRLMGVMTPDPETTGVKNRGSARKERSDQSKGKKARKAKVA